MSEGRELSFWTVGRKLGGLFLLVAVLFAWGASSGLRGVDTLSEKINHFLGPVWGQVSGAADVSRAVSDLMIAANRFRAADDAELAVAREGFDRARNALRGAEANLAEVLPGKAGEVGAVLKRFRSTQDRALQAETTFARENRELLQDFEEFQDFILHLRKFESLQEELGGGAPSEPDEFDLGAGLAEALAASSGTDVHVQLLEWFYRYQKLVNDASSLTGDEATRALEASLNELSMTASSLGSLPLFQVPPDDRSLGEGTYAEILSGFLGRHATEYREAVEALAASRKASEEYRVASAEALAYLAKLRDETARVLAGQTQEVRGAGSTARRALQISLAVVVMLSLVVWAYVGIYLTSPLRDVAEAMERFAAGEKRVVVPEVSTGDEVESLVRSLGTLVAEVTEREDRIRQAALLLGSEAKTLTAAASDQSEVITEQADSIRQTASAAAELRSMTLKAKEVATSVHAQTAASEQASREGGEANQAAKERVVLLARRINEISDTVASLSKKMDQIGEILAAVNELAEQSKLLALNAAIEAARAGEHGKGFGVVSLEVRNLAQQSQDATRQIRTIIREIAETMAPALAASEEGQADARRGQEAIARTEAVIERMAEVINESRQSAANILKSVNQQDIGIERISGAIDAIDAALSRSSETAERTRVVSEKLVEAEEDLKKLFGSEDTEPRTGA